MRALRLALAAALLPLAGCLDAADSLVPGALVDGPPLAPRVLAHDGRGAPVALPERAPVMAFDLVPLGHGGAEPTIGIHPDGELFVIADTTVLRSGDGGRTWVDVTPVANWPAGSLDPYLWVDPLTGRVFVDHLYVGCSYLSWSDDKGATWLTNPAACGLPVNDHQTVATGAPRALPAGLLHPSVVYYGYNGLVYSGVARSFDGGATFAGATMAIDQAHCGGLNGHLKAAPDGTLYLPAAGCDEPVVAVSRDNGATWEQHVIDTGGVGRSPPGDDPSIALDDAGNAYLLWPGKDALMYGAVSTDAGLTWSAPFHVSPPHVTSTLFAASVAGAPGRVAFAYYGTTTSTESWASPHSDDAPDDVRWHLFVTYSLNALAGADATFVTLQLTTEEDPIQIGRIHNGGADGTPDRNLLDFFDMARDAEGRVFVAYTDGCPACADRTTRAQDVHVAAFGGGPRLV